MVRVTRLELARKALPSESSVSTNSTIPSYKLIKMTTIQNKNKTLPIQLKIISLFFLLKYKLMPPQIGAAKLPIKPKNTDRIDKIFASVISFLIFLWSLIFIHLNSSFYFKKEFIINPHPKHLGPV